MMRGFVKKWFSQKEFSFGEIATVSVDTGNVVIFGWEFKWRISSLSAFSRRENKDVGAWMAQ